MQFTPGRLWWLARRDFRRGLKACWHDYVVGPRIWQWRNPHAASPAQNLPVHVVLGSEHMPMAAWMLASWTIATARNWRIVLHDDGSIPAEALARFERLGLNVTMIPRAAADAKMAPMLMARSNCRQYRASYPLGLKIFDVPALATEERLLLIDPDVLFFAFPTEILKWVDELDAESCCFNRDVSEASNVSPGEAKERLGISLWPRVNSGLCLLTRQAIDLDFCERALSETQLLAGHFWRVEQTLFALCASRHARGGLLSENYEVSLGAQMRSGAIARHYVGAVRARFWAEGVGRVRRILSL